MVGGKSWAMARFADVPVERSLAVADVEDHAAVAGGAHRRSDLAILVEDAVRHPVVHVGHHVALAHHRQHLIQRFRPGVLRVDHDRQPGGVGRLAGEVERFDPGVLAAIERRVRRTLTPSTRSRLASIAASAFGTLAHLMSSSSPTSREIMPIEEMLTWARMRVSLASMTYLRKPSKGVGAGGTGVDDGCGAGGEAGVSGVDAVVGDAFVDVDMGVDQTGGDDLTIGVNRLRCLGGVDLFRHGDDFAVREGDIAPGVDALRSIDERAAGDQQVVSRHGMLLG